MNIDVGKVTPWQLLAIIFSIGFLVMLAFGSLFFLSYFNDRPFVINGKEFGFNASSVEKRMSDLKACEIKLTAERESSDNAVKTLSKRNIELTELNKKMSAELKRFTKLEDALWFPVEDIAFRKGGFFQEQNSNIKGRGVWSNNDSELSLKMVGQARGEIVLETNLPAPGNKIRLKNREVIRIPMARWEYLVTLIDISYEEEFFVRVERRSKI